MVSRSNRYYILVLVWKRPTVKIIFVTIRFEVRMTLLPLPIKVRSILISKMQFDFVQASLGSISFQLFRQTLFYIYR